jgi:hypothetical protein
MLTNIRHKEKAMRTKGSSVRVLASSFPMCAYWLCCRILIQIVRTTSTLLHPDDPLYSIPKTQFAQSDLPAVYRI